MGVGGVERGVDEGRGGDYRRYVWSKFGTNVSSWRETFIKTRSCFQHFTLNRSSTDRPKEAEKYYRKALAIKPDSADANINLAHLLRVTNRLREADQQYNKAQSLRPGDPQLYFQHGVVLEKLERRKVCYLLLLFFMVSISRLYDLGRIHLGELFSGVFAIVKTNHVSLFTKLITFFLCSLNQSRAFFVH